MKYLQLCFNIIIIYLFCLLKHLSWVLELLKYWLIMLDAGVVKVHMPGQFPTLLLVCVTLETTQ